jgi:MFS family permease
MSDAASSATTRSGWRTPIIVLLCGGIILTLALGHATHLRPLPAADDADLGWTRQTFSIALALQNLVYGLASPFAGMVADKYGAARAVIAGTLTYALGLALMAYAQTGWDFSLSAGLLIGIGMSCTGFGIVFGVVGRAFPPAKRTIALGIVSSAGSFGQFLMLPYGQLLISSMGWHNALLVCAVTILLILPLSAALVEDRRESANPVQRQSIAEALREAFGHSGYMLLCSGYFVCGFQLMFISVHFPAFLTDQHMTPETGMTALALIGLFNILGSFAGAGPATATRRNTCSPALYFTGRWRSRSSSRCRSRRSRCISSAPPSASCGSARCRHRRPDRPHLRRELPLHADRHRLSVPPGRQLLGVWIAAWLFDSTGSTG